MSIAGCTPELPEDKDAPEGDSIFNRVVHRLGKTALGIADLTKAMELEPNDASVPFNRGLMYLAISLVDHAIADFDKAIELDPRSVDAHLNRGFACHQIGQYSQAIKSF